MHAQVAAGEVVIYQRRDTSYNNDDVRRDQSMACATYNAVTRNQNKDIPACG
jgi:hypothetical protein